MQPEAEPVQPRDQYRVRQRTTKLTVAVNGGEATPAALPPMTTAIAARASMAVSTPAVPSAHAIAGRSAEAPPDLCGNGLRPYRV